jgi:hypothetical protein
MPGIKAEFINLLGGQSVDITDRQVKGKVTVDATVAQELAFYTAIKGTTLQSVGLIHGSVVGRRFGVFGPNVQMVAPSKAEMQGKRLIDLGLNFIPRTPATTSSRSSPASDQRARRASRAVRIPQPTKQSTMKFFPTPSPSYFAPASIQLLDAHGALKEFPFDVRIQALQAQRARGARCGHGRGARCPAWT